MGEVQKVLDKGELTVVSHGSQSIKAKEIMSYGIGNLALSLFTSIASSFIMYFYTEIAGIAVAAVGLILLFSRVLDGILDIAMGLLVDRTWSKYGKARPWLLWTCIPFGLAVVLMFSAPELGVNGKIIYAFITYTVAFIIYTATSIPYMTLLSTTTQDQYQRGKLAISKTLLGFAAGLLVTVFTLPIVKALGGGKQGWLGVAGIYGVLAIIALYITFRNTQERVLVQPQSNESHSLKVPLKKTLMTLIKNKYWLLITGVAFLVFIQSGLNGGIIYYAKYVLGDSELVGVIGIASSVPLILTVLLMGPLMKRFSKRNLSIVGFIFVAAGALIILINPDHLTYVIVGKIVSCAGLALPSVSIPAMVADTVDYGEWKTGIRNEGILFSAESMGTKIGAGIGGLLLGGIMAIGGYIGGHDIQTPKAIASIQFANIHTMIIVSLLSIALLYFYKLDKEYPAIISDLIKRRGN